MPGRRGRPLFGMSASGATELRKPGVSGDLDHSLSGGAGDGRQVQPAWQEESRVKPTFPTGTTVTSTSSPSSSSVASPVTGGGEEEAGRGGGGDASSPTNTTPPKKTFTLSAYAAEFVPRYMQTNTPDEFQAEEDDMFAGDPACRQMAEVITKLTVNPGSFYDLVNPLIDSLNAHAETEQSLQICVDLVIDQAIMEPNFTYTGARLCDHLSKHLHVKVASGNFRQLLLARLHLQFKKRDELMANESTIHLVQGLLVFLGELFTQMEVVKDGRSQKIELFYAAIKNVINTLLTQPNDSNLVCVARVLKMTGAGLEDKERELVGAPLTEAQDSLDAIFQHIKQLTMETNVSMRTKSLLGNVIDLRAADWGRTPGSPAVNADMSPPIGEFASNVPVFYNTDGSTVPIEDMGYYYDSEVGDYVPYSSEDGSENSALYQNEMGPDLQEVFDDIDDEIASDYEKFMMDSQK
ncbi:PREDICTED: polyadenylate-binding protein-interacting protein 1-like isoform X2 [Priapulus caudatus]|uniref:Polyadenylate-binding protein-interacting protein 1-like isoform X2 n=1 Tax=Priapulus caudatus TaxID=37621 RepID=A0ABM1DNA5_PRICU|nr:PREDICTED: polyadenylate-binding protein-interacting protein 1-like isoform X2 [Priapulus caudatus]